MASWLSPSFIPGLRCNPEVAHQFCGPSVCLPTACTSIPSWAHVCDLGLAEMHSITRDCLFCRFEIWNDDEIIHTHSTVAEYSTPVAVGQTRTVMFRFDSINYAYEVLDVDITTGATAYVTGDTTAFLTQVCLPILCCALFLALSVCFILCPKRAVSSIQRT